MKVCQQDRGGNFGERSQLPTIEQAAPSLLMDRVLLIILFLAPGLAWGQKFFPISIDPSREYNIVRQDSIVDHFGEMLPISADLSVVNWGDDPYDMYAIRFSDAKTKGDTIYVHIHETNTVYDYDYDLKIVDGKFSANFWYQVTIDSALRKIETLESKLIVKTKSFKKGSFLIGYTEYKGRCISLFDKNEIYIVRGTFKVRLE